MSGTIHMEYKGVTVEVSVGDGKRIAALTEGRYKEVSKPESKKASKPKKEDKPKAEKADKAKEGE